MGKFDTHGGHFVPQGYMKVEAGGSHEENPNGGVQIGVDTEGIPNMLEEGEPVYDDYVYSDNIVAEADILAKHNIPEKYAGKLYSKIADAYVDEAAEMPLDPIANNGLNAMLVRLADAQEEQKAIQQQKELEEELSKMSPEELAELEQVLAEQEAAEVQSQMPMEQIPEQPIMPMENNTMMQPFGCGGKMKRYADGGDMTIDEFISEYGTDPFIYTRLHGGLPEGVTIVEGTITPTASMTPQELSRISGNGLMVAPPATNSSVSAMEAAGISKPSVSTSNTPVTKTTTTTGALPTWPRYAGVAASGLLALHNIATEPDKYTLPRYNPVLPSARMHLTDPTYIPIDQNQIVNDVLANSAGTRREIVNAGMGPSVGATLLAQDYNTGRNLGAAREQAIAANNAARNAVIAARNQKASTLGNFHYGQNRDISGILNQAQLHNLRNNLLRQQLYYQGERARSAAIQQQIDNLVEALAGIGQENFAMNQLNSNSAFNYGAGRNGWNYYKR